MISSIRRRDFADKVRATYWYMPTLMTLAAALAALMLFWADQSLPRGIFQGNWLILPVEDIADARSILATMAETTLGVIGVVFSITLVPLSISATQYGSIVLRSFLRDRSTQIVLGAYTSTTFYCLVLDLALRNAPDSAIQLSVSFAVYLLLLSLLLLIYFFHHVADSLQVAALIENLSRELQEVINKEYPVGRSAPDLRQGDATAREQVMRGGEVITSSREGYVRAVDYGELVEIAAKHNATIYLESLPGDFICRGDPVARASPAAHANDLASAINRTFMLGRNRTVFQDPAYGIYLIVAIATRALSPAINDPTTPVFCLNRIGAALSMLAEREGPPSYYYDGNNRLRMISDRFNFEDLTDVAFNLIRQCARVNAEVLMTMLRTIKMISIHVHSDAQRRALQKHVTLVDQDSHIGILSEYDRQRVHGSYEDAMKALSSER